MRCGRLRLNSTAICEAILLSLWVPNALSGFASFLANLAERTQCKYTGGGCTRTSRSISRSAPSTGLENPGKILLELIEVQTGSYLGEDDIIRIEDDYQRS